LWVFYERTHEFLSQYTQHVPDGYDQIKLMGSFTDNSLLYPLEFLWAN